MQKVNTTEDLLKLEKVVRKIINKSLKDRTLDYTVQFSVSSLEPKKVKYAFMINGTKNEVRIEPQAHDSFATTLAIAEGMVDSIDPVEVERTFHTSRINTYNTAIKQHEGRLKWLEKHPDGDPDDVEMEKV